MDTLHLQIEGFRFEDLFDPVCLAKLNARFLADVRAADPHLLAEFERYRAGVPLSSTQISTILISMGRQLGAFVARLFGVEAECGRLALRARREQTIFRFKKEFFVRRALKRVSRDQAVKCDPQVLDEQAGALRTACCRTTNDDLELSTAATVLELLEHERFLKVALPEATRTFLRSLAERLRDERSLQGILPASLEDSALKEFLSAAMRIFEEWTVRRYYMRDRESSAWATFKVPQPLDFHHLVEVNTLQEPVPDFNVGPDERMRRRQGFDLTDSRFSYRETMSEVDYCIFCHQRDKDSCSKGLKEGDDYRRNPLGFVLKGCPLDQKISESQLLQGEGETLGALAVIMIDNPMVPGTGHRICNDCMKACIFQKQDPVNIPQIETRILTDVLELPWGFEIYSLLTRWNPLNIRRPSMLPYNGIKVLVVGLGPAGYTLAHHLLNEGFGVVGIDALKIEPLPAELLGDGMTGLRPVKEIGVLREELSKRILAGFGGVSEYGITVRWDKNFLTIIYLNLVRRRYFRMYDGVRFGGTVTVDDAWKYGFDHLCIAAGAGKPAFVSMKNNLIRGIRKASDFLMALQLTGAGKEDSMANLQVQLPAVVIGGGLTAIDTATELMAYYPLQVTKIKKRFDALVERYGGDEVLSMFDSEERSRLETFLAHAAEIARERQRAGEAGEEPNIAALVRRWGGVAIYYRKSMLDSPAYRLNHEEIIKSLEEGIAFVERMSPVEAVPDQFGAVHEMIFERQRHVEGKWQSTGERMRVPAKTVMVAAGTVPNVMYEREHPGTFRLDGKSQFFAAYQMDEDGDGIAEAGDRARAFFTSYAEGGKRVTFYGDNHPVYEGNVVKAMASAKEGARAVVNLFRGRLEEAGKHAPPQDDWNRLIAVLDDDLRPSVVRVNRLTRTITEVVVRAPKAAREFHPGQFYRLQSYERDALRLEDTRLTMEGVALTGAWVDKESGVIGLIALEVGASSRMCALLRPGQRLVVMGPTGSPTEITVGGTVLLLGGGLGNAVLFSIAKAFKANGATVVYFAGYKRGEDLFKREEIEESTDITVYSVDTGEPIETRRESDKSFIGNIVQAMLAYARGELGVTPVPLSSADRIIAIGSDRMMAAVTEARHGALAPYLNDSHIGIASVNSPMQCMMKAVCAQCLQRHVDPKTGKEEFVFSCVNQDQLMDQVDFSHLRARLRANSVMEKIADRWLGYLLEKYSVPRV